MVLFETRLQRLGKHFKIEPTSIQVCKSCFPSAPVLFEDIVYKALDTFTHLNGMSLIQKSTKVILLSNYLRLLALSSIKNIKDLEIKCTPYGSSAINRSPSELVMLDTDRWACVRCTYINSIITLQCDVCGSIKPVCMASSSSEKSPKRQQLKRSIESIQQSILVREVIVIDDDDDDESSDEAKNGDFNLFSASIDRCNSCKDETSSDSKFSNWRIEEWQRRSGGAGVQRSPPWQPADEPGRCEGMRYHLSCTHMYRTLYDASAMVLLPSQRAARCVDATAPHLFSALNLGRPLPPLPKTIQFICHRRDSS